MDPSYISYLKNGINYEQEKISAIRSADTISPRQNIPCNKVFPMQYKLGTHFAPTALPNAHSTTQQLNKPARTLI